MILNHDLTPPFLTQTDKWIIACLKRPCTTVHTEKKISRRCLNVRPFLFKMYVRSITYENLTICHTPQFFDKRTTLVLPTVLFFIASSQALDFFKTLFSSFPTDRSYCIRPFLGVFGFHNE